MAMSQPSEDLSALSGLAIKDLEYARSRRTWWQALVLTSVCELRTVGCGWLVALGEGLAVACPSVLGVRAIYGSIAFIEAALGDAAGGKAACVRPQLGVGVEVVRGLTYTRNAFHALVVNGVIGAPLVADVKFKYPIASGAHIFLGRAAAYFVRVR